MRCNMVFYKKVNGKDIECKESDPETNLVVLIVGGFYLNVDKFYFADRKGFSELVEFIVNQSKCAEEMAADDVRNSIKEILNIRESN